MLERLIEEEVLVQRAFEIGLTTSDKALRGAVVRAMISTAITEEEARAVSSAELKSFYKNNTDYFSVAAKLQIRRVILKDASKVQVKEIQKIMIEYKKLPADLAEFTVEAIAPVPDVLLPIAKLRQYIGPTLAEAAARLRPGQVSTPIKSGDNFHIIFVKDSRKGVAPPFNKIKSLVEREFRKRRSDNALKSYAAWLKSRAEIERSADL